MNIARLCPSSSYCFNRCLLIICTVYIYVTKYVSTVSYCGHYVHTVHAPTMRTHVPTKYCG